MGGLAEELRSWLGAPPGPIISLAGVIAATARLPYTQDEHIRIEKAISGAREFWHLPLIMEPCRQDIKAKRGWFSARLGEGLAYMSAVDMGFGAATNDMARVDVAILKSDGGRTSFLGRQKALYQTFISADDHPTDAYFPGPVQATLKGSIADAVHVFKAIRDMKERVDHDFGART